MTAWLTVIGLGDEGLEGLGAPARAAIAEAELLVGGQRHLALIPAGGKSRLAWQEGVRAVLDDIARWRGRRVVVLTSGDPMWFGAGAHVARRFPVAELTILPHPGAFSLAAARMGWSLAEIATLTVHGRPLATLNLHIQPGARLLVLSWDGDTPAGAAALLVERGFGPSRITVLEHLGGPKERRIEGIAETWDAPRAADLNTLAIECRAGASPRLLPPVPGLPDAVFESDGQLTKQEVRAITLSALAPLPGQTLWDIGAGSGSIAIEWLRALSGPGLGGVGEARAFAIERDPARCGAIALNAAALGVPRLMVVTGTAPVALAGLPVPDRVFLGGGARDPALWTAAWQALPSGGRLIVNAATLEAQATLFRFHAAHGGEARRIAISRAGAIGDAWVFRPMIEVSQYVGIKT